MTLTSLASLLTALAAGLAIFGSGFLVVTEAFDCTEAVFTLASDKFFFVGVAVALATVLATTGAAARTALGAVLALDFLAAAAGAAFAGDVTAFTAVAAVVPTGFAAVVFFGTDRITGVEGVDLLASLAAGLMFLAEGVGVFAVFFIAFAIESTAK